MGVQAYSRNDREITATYPELAERARLLGGRRAVLDGEIVALNGERPSAGVVAYHREPAFRSTTDLERSGYVLHDTTDPDVFIAEVDVAFNAATGPSTVLSYVRIFRVRDGRIVRLRDYFSPPVR